MEHLSRNSHHLEDHLFPYLFILCSEVLSHMLVTAEMKGHISGFPFAQGTLLVNHLSFANDSLLFCKANALEWSRLYRLLNSYEVASGQRLNLENTSIYFSRNTRSAAKESSPAGLRETRSFEKYLELPSYVGKHKLVVFRPILDSIRNKMNNWKVRFLS